MGKQHRQSIEGLPVDVKMVRGYLPCRSLDEKEAYLSGIESRSRMTAPEADDEVHLCELMLTLSGDPEHVRMWNAIERRIIRSDVSWVYVFLNAVQEARQLPVYFYRTAADRRDLLGIIRDATDTLKKIYKTNNLEFNLVYLDGANFKGFYALEDFSDKMQDSIKKKQLDLLSVTAILDNIEARAAEMFGAVPPGKVGANVRAVRFVRHLAAWNQRFYRRPLYAVVATAANSLFNTSYSESDIRKLLERRPKAGLRGGQSLPG